MTGLRVAVVGTGPAAMYAVWELLEHRGVEIELYDRALTPYGLIRAGVAPDHPSTKAVVSSFERAARRPNVTMHLGIEVGRHITNTDLLAHHSAVIYATGAAVDRRSDVPGAELPGVHSATEFVAWYNGHPDYADRSFDFSSERAIVVGNGNVAVDVARVLLTDPAQLARTDIADHALEALRGSRIREVVILGRRGPAQAAYTNPELIALLDLEDVDVVIEADEAIPDTLSAADLEAPECEPAAQLKAQLALEISARPITEAAKRLVLRYLVSPVRFAGADAVSSVHIARNTLTRSADGTLRACTGAHSETIDAGLVLQSIGYRGTGVPDVPFDAGRGVIPNSSGRVLTERDGVPVPRLYTTGWIKRGPSGVIGTNKRCARETVTCVIEDASAGLLPVAPDRSALMDLLSRRQPDLLDHAAWSRIDTAERLAGRAAGRPRIKFTTTAALRAAATS